jgi:hypothetical protein
MQPHVITGNAQVDGNPYRGWFIGSFIPSSDALRSTAAIEVKWGTHTAGEQRSDWSPPAATTTLSILISGRFRIQFLDREVILSQPGDYALWSAGVAHSWLAEENSIILTVRWLDSPGERQRI